MTEKKSKSPKKATEPLEETEVDELMVVLDSYNQADEIYVDLQKKKVEIPEPLKFTYFDSKAEGNVDSKTDGKTSSKAEEEKKSTLDIFDPTDEPFSETESLKSFGDSDDEDNHPGDDDEPKYIDRIIFRFQEDFIISDCLMNKWDRKVYTAIRREDNLPVVIIVANDNVRRLRKNDMPREIRLMKHVKGHENVANILGWCPIDKRNYVILMPYYENCDIISATKGDLYIVSKIMKSILTGVKYLHDKHVAHRDLARYNILWNPVTEQAVIIDFDTSCFFRPKGFYRDVGRDKYDAPEKTEIIELRKELWAEYDETGKKPKSKKQKPYTEKADIYSLGVLFWMLINNKTHSPEPPFLKRWTKKIREKNKHKKFPELDLLLRMLNFDPVSRISAAEALNHPFILDSKSSDKSYLEMKNYLQKMLNNEDEDDDADADFNAKYPDDDDDDDDDNTLKDPHDGLEKEEHKTLERDDGDASEFSTSESEESYGK